MTLNYPKFKGLKYWKGYKRTNMWDVAKTAIKGNPKLAFYMAKKALRGIAYLKGLVNSEMNKADFNNTGTTITISNAPQLAIRLAEGTDEGNRLGYSILLRGMRLGYRIRNNTTTPTPSCAVRVMLVLDTQQIGDTSPGLSDIFQDTDTYNIIESALNKATVGRFKILYNKVHYLDTLTKPQVYVKKYIKMMHHVRYNGSAYTDVQKGAVYLVYVCDNTNVSYNNPVLDHDIRSYYHDN